jgi:putative flippase GtrA
VTGPGAASEGGPVGAPAAVPEVRSARAVIAEHARQASAFLVIGGLAFLVDAGVYNLLVFISGRGPLFDQPLTAKIIAVVTASVVTYVGNRLWTFRSRKTPTTARRLGMFVALNLVAIGIQLGCLAVSRYVLGLADPVADNISGTLIGQALATGFRYVTYERWVFPHVEADDVDDAGVGGTGVEGGADVPTRGEPS